MEISTNWLTYLGIAAAWTTLFSLTINPAIRGYRNFGILACYILGLITPFRVGITSAALTWAAWGLTAGVLYLLYDIWTYAKATEPTDKPRVSHLISGLIVWPIMLPEVVEYTLAELGLLKTPPIPVSADTTGNPVDAADVKA